MSKGSRSVFRESGGVQRREDWFDHEWHEWELAIGRLFFIREIRAIRGCAIGATSALEPSLKEEGERLDGQPAAGRSEQAPAGMVGAER